MTSIRTGKSFTHTHAHKCVHMHKRAERLINVGGVKVRYFSFIMSFSSAWKASPPPSAAFTLAYSHSLLLLHLASQSFLSLEKLSPMSLTTLIPPVK